MKPSLHWNGFPWQVKDWGAHVELLQGCGFTWATHLVRPSMGMNWRFDVFDTLADAGLKVRLWVVADVKNVPFCPRSIIITDGEATPDNPDLDISKRKAINYVKEFCERVVACGLLLNADAVACAWSGTFEVDQRLWHGTPNENHAGQKAVYETLRQMVGRLAPSQPLCGGQRGSLWHAQPGRCNYAPDSTLPLPLKSEKALWLADAIPWTRFGGQHSGIADELEALAFGCDLARGTGAEMIVNEHDDPQQIEPESRVFEKARLLVDHGVHPAFIDATYEQILARRAMYNAIASYCAAAPDMNPVTDAPWVYGPLLQAFAQWKALGGGKSKSVPVRWSFAGHGPDNE